MTGNITLALKTAQSGLSASQAALDTVANNISNVNTEGYSRKIVQLEQRVVAGTGAGVQLGTVQRAVDEGLLKSLRLELADFQRLDAATSYFERMQEMFGSPADNSSINHTLTEFGKSLESLALSPQRTVEQSDAVRWASEVGEQLRKMSDTLQELRLQADREISNVASRINTLTDSIVDFNNKIIRNETVGHDVSDLKDKRDLALTELAGLTDIRYFTRNQGEVVVVTGGGHVLVDGTAQDITHTAASAVTATTTYGEGDFNGIFVGAQAASNDLTSSVQNGKLKALIELRDNTLPDLQTQLDELASELRDSINQIHNRGVPYPGLSDETGTATFVNANATMTLKDSDDVWITMMDSSGDEAAKVALSQLMTDANFGNDASNRGPWTVTSVLQEVQDWINDNPDAGGGSLSGAGLGISGASVALDGTTNKLTLNLNSSTYSIAFRDEAAINTAGSTSTDATIRFDTTGDGFIDREVDGFSNFFGLNDFFSDGLEPTLWDSQTKNSSYTWTPTGANVTLNFTDKDGNTGNTTFTAGTTYTLSEIASAINTDVSFVEASVIPDGSGYRLRVAHDDSVPMEVHDNQGLGATASFIDALGMGESPSRVSRFLDVRSDIKSTPSKISNALVQWDSTKGTSGEYAVSRGDNTISLALAEAMTSANSFNSAGGLSNSDMRFEEYAAEILGYSSALADDNETDLSAQKALTDSLRLKSDSAKGVNLDEEMSQLILYQTSYAAAARVISTIQKLFEELTNAV